MLMRSLMGLVGLSLLGTQACSGGVEADDEGVDGADEVDSVEQDLVARPRPRPLPLPKLQPDAPMCGGIAAIDCPGSGRCVDDPYDDCSPNQGGADCSGLCVCVPPRLDKLRPPPGIPTDVCGPGRRFDASPEVCACVPAELDPCARVLCAPGTVCVSEGSRPACVPLPPVD